MEGKIPVPLPMVLGHEGAGVVEAVGPEGSLKVGARVVMTLVMPCMKCSFCQAGRPSICTGRAKAVPVGCVLGSEREALNIMTGLGCMAEYAVVSEDACVKVDTDVSLEKAALVSC